MPRDVIIGCALLVVAVASIIVLVLQSRRTIERIARRKRGTGSARETLQEFRDDQ
jgi:hypothetical protein